MMDHEDFGEIMLLLEKSCDQCLLTFRHCANCRIDKLRKLLGQLDSQSNNLLLVSVEEMRVLLSLARDSGNSGETEIVNKWRQIIS